MTDLTDDWMNPKSYSWTPPKRENKMVYAIERARKRIVSGNPGFILDWEAWANYGAAAERDEALVKLRTEHPMWKLRERDYNPYHEIMWALGA